MGGRHFNNANFKKVSGKTINWSDRLVMERSHVQVLAEAAGDFSSPGSTFCADSYFGIGSISVLPQ